MLVVMSSSCCDICTEEYAESPARSPHAIGCGHIFCRSYVIQTGFDIRIG